MKKKSSGLNSAMKKVGRNLARVANQSGSSKVPMKYASGGAIRIPASKDMGSMGGSGMEQSGFGAGKARGGHASRGNKFSGTH